MDFQFHSLYYSCPTRLFNFYIVVVVDSKGKRFTQYSNSCGLHSLGYYYLIFSSQNKLALLHSREALSLRSPGNTVDSPWGRVIAKEDRMMQIYPISLGDWSVSLPCLLQCEWNWTEWTANDQPGGCLALASNYHTMARYGWNMYGGGITWNSLVAFVYTHVGPTYR